MEDINTQDYFKLNDEERLQYDRFIYHLCETHLNELASQMELTEAKDIFLSSLSVQKEEYLEGEEYEVCEIITNAINYIKNYNNAASTKKTK